MAEEDEGDEVEMDDLSESDDENNKYEEDYDKEEEEEEVDDVVDNSSTVSLLYPVYWFQVSLTCFQGVER